MEAPSDLIICFHPAIHTAWRDAQGGLSCMLLHDRAVLGEPWEVGLRPAHPHRLVA